MRCKITTASRRIWTMLSLTMTALSYLHALHHETLRAVICLALAVACAAYTGVRLAEMLALVCVSAAVLFSLALSFMKLCTFGAVLCARAITSASTTFMNVSVKCCSWSLRSRMTKCSRLLGAYWTAHTSVSTKTVSARFSDL